MRLQGFNGAVRWVYESNGIAEQLSSIPERQPADYAGENAWKVNPSLVDQMKSKPRGFYLP